MSVWTAASAAPAASAAAAGNGWRAAGDRQDIELAYRPAQSGYRAYRGSVPVCTDLDGLQRFVADASRLDEWIPYTQEARALPADGGHERYYMKTDAPWPFRSRDMVYELRRQPADSDGTIRIRIHGLPAAAPEQPGAVRMASAEGAWSLTPGNGRVRVSLWLAADPVRVPAFFANRRLAAMVAGTLHNLADQFPCDGPS